MALCGCLDAPQRPWRTILAALKDPARSEFAFVPHQYIYAPFDVDNDSLSPNESTPINTRKHDIHEGSPNPSFSAALPSKHPQFFLRHVVAIGLAGFCMQWLLLFPISPNRLYNMQVDVFNTSHAHANFFFKPCLFLGNMFGAAGAGYLGDRLGRAGTLELAAIPYIIGWLLVGVAYGEITVLLGRYCLGVAAGLMSVVAPVYLAEICCSAHIRGRLMCVYVLLAGLGRLCYLGVGAIFIYLSRSYFGFNLSEWKVLAMTGLIPGFALLLMMQCLPDSPTWFVVRHRDHETAFAILVKLVGGNYQRAEANVNAIIHANVLTRTHSNAQCAFVRPLLLCISLFTLRTITLYLVQPTLSSTPSRSFMVTIFGVGLDIGEVELLYVTTFLWVAASMGTVVCFLLVDNRGRLFALRAGCAIVVLVCFLVLIAHRFFFTPLPFSFQVQDAGSAGLLMLLAGQELGLGIVPLVFVSEFFPAHRRLPFVSLVFIWEAMVNYGLSYLMPWLRSQLAFFNVFVWSLLTVLVCHCIALGLSVWYLPETSRQSLEAIEAILSGWTPATPQLKGFGAKVRLRASPLGYGT